MAWKVPTVCKTLQTDKLSAPENSKVLSSQKQLLKAMQATLNAVYRDVREGLLETVGVECVLVVDDRCSVALQLVEGTDTQLVARAIDLENVEAWLDKKGRVHVAINPWYSTKDVDQTVLSIVKVIHVLLGIHASDSAKLKKMTGKLFAAVKEVLLIQKSAGRNK